MVIHVGACKYMEMYPIPVWSKAETSTWISSVYATSA